MGGHAVNSRSGRLELRFESLCTWPETLPFQWIERLFLSHRFLHELEKNTPLQTKIAQSEVLPEFLIGKRERVSMSFLVPCGHYLPP